MHRSWQTGEYRCLFWTNILKWKVLLYNRNFTEKNEGQEELTTIRHRQQWEQDTEQKITTPKKEKIKTNKQNQHWKRWATRFPRLKTPNYSNILQRICWWSSLYPITSSTCIVFYRITIYMLVSISTSADIGRGVLDWTHYANKCDRSIILANCTDYSFCRNWSPR
jgi:hypothetical protein